MSLAITAFGLAALASTNASKPAAQSADTASRIALAELASCIVRRQTARARQAVLEDWDSAQLVYRDLLHESDCYPAGLRMRFPGGVLKAAMAGELVKRDLTPADAGAAANAPALTYRLPGDPRTAASTNQRAARRSSKRQEEATADRIKWIAIAQFGECVARSNPAAVTELTRTAPASAEELSALKLFGQHMPGCLPKGVTLELDRSTLRGAITLAYYRLAMGARAAALETAE